MNILDFLKNDEQEEQCIEAVGFAGSSSSWQEALRMARVAIVNPNLTVLITGETGVGKDMLALHIHEASLVHKAGRLPFGA